MIENPISDLTAKTDPAHRLYADMLKHAGPHEMRKLLKTIVARGDIDVLRIALYSGLIGADKDDFLTLVCAMPLVDAVPDSEKARAEEFVNEWIRAFEPIDPVKLDIALAAADDEVARQLISLGANPNGFAGESQTLTVLGRTFGTRMFASARSMLRTLAERDELPIQARNVVPDAATSLGGRRAPWTGAAPESISYFAGLIAEIGAGINGGIMSLLAEHVTQIVETIDMPGAWRRDIGASFARAAEGWQCQRGGGRTQLFAALLLQAEFDMPADCLRAVSFFAEDLRKEDCADLVGALARKLVESGSHPDQVLVRTIPEAGLATPSTWLQAAAFYNQHDMVGRLLEAGADPAYRSFHDRGKNAYEMAQWRSPEAMQVLLSWKAKTAVDSVLRERTSGANLHAS
jgi:hypothetical protein